MVGMSGTARILAGGDRRRLLSSCAAIAMLAAPSPLRAQAFNAVNNTPTQNNAIVSNNGPTGTIVNVTGAQAIIDWEPNTAALAANGGTGAIDFFPAGHTISFESGYGFTALNRIDSANAPLTRPITLDGTVNSSVNGAQGGNVWFYSPAGIIAGPDAVFNVGGLLLTTGVVDTTGGLYGNGPLNSGPGGNLLAAEITVNSPAGSQAAVVISPTAQINAQIAANSYVALVAPRVVQGGSVNVRGGVAYAAGEAAQIGFNTDGGLVAVNVSIGTQVGIVAGDNVTLTHSGTTTGPGSGGANDLHNIFFVAIPKNDAVTMLLTGSIGYQAAFNASVQNGAIVLGAGTSVDAISAPESSYGGIPTATFSGNIDVAAGTFRSDVTAFYTGSANISSRLGDLSFTKNLVVRPAYGSGAIGNTTLEASNGHNLTVDGNLTLYADGGRTAQAIADAGSVLRVNGSALIIANQLGLDETGYGPYTPAGPATGATALVTADGGNAIFAGTLDLEAEGQGGYGANLGGGNGTGGTARLTAQAGGSVVVTGAATINANGIGGNGSSGPGGVGTGGVAGIVVNDGTISFDAGANVSASGFGGSSSSGPGGSGVGGTTNVILTNGVVATPADVVLNFNTTSFGGAGATDGASTGGHTSVSATGNSQLAPQGVLNVGAVGLTSQSGTATGGTIDTTFGAAAGDVVEVGDLTLSAADIHLIGNGPVPGSLSGTGGTINLADNGGAITIASLGASTGHYAGSFGSNGQLQLTAVTSPPVTGGGVNLALAAGSPLVVTNQATIAHTAGVTIAAGGSGGLAVGGAFSIDDAASLSLAHDARAGDTVSADAVSINVRGPVSGGNSAIDATNAIAITTSASAALGDMTAGGDIDVTAPGGMTAATVMAGGAVQLTASAGSIGATGKISAGTTIALNAGTTAALGDLGAGGDIDVTAPGGIAAAAITSGGAVQLTASGGPIDATGLLTASSLTASAGGDIDLAAATVSGDAALNAGGDIDADGLDISGTLTAAGDDVTLAAVAPLHVGAATARNGALTINGTDLRLDGASAATAIDLQLSGTASMAGDVAAPTITVASADIAIDPAARIGIDTNAITLTNTGGGRTVVGGDGTADTWSLSNAEFGRLSAHTITINAPAVEDRYALEIGQLDVIGSAGADSGSRRQNLTGSDLVFSSGGSALVDGAIRLTGAGAGDTLTIDAAGHLDIVTPGGSIALSGPDGALGGTLDLRADTIFVGSQQALTDLASLASIGARNTRLDTNDGAVDAAGYIQANGLALTGDTGIYIQNSGTKESPDTRAGFTVGDGGITIGSTSQTKTEVIINGRQADAAAPGGFVTGAALIPLLRFNESATENGLARGSTANTCLLDGTPCGVRVVVPSFPPVQDVINTRLDPSAQLAFLVQLPLIDLGDVVSVGLEPLIDDPVTGAGNEDMWLGSSDLDDDRKKDKAKGAAHGAAD